MNNFCESLILLKNPKLNKEDLVMLNKLCEKYDILHYYENILKYNITEIINKIIINELPYKISSVLVYDDKIVTQVLYVDSDHIIHPYKNHIGQEFIDREIEKMNSWLKYVNL